jgi:iron complex transport system substrate-binding protein
LVTRETAGIREIVIQRTRAVVFFLVLMLASSLSCSDQDAVDQQGQLPDDRLVVLGPSLVELFCELGAGELMVGVDRYSNWPEWVTGLQDVGGYLDPSLEVIHELRPTSIHSVGFNAELDALAAEADLSGGYSSYSFDRLEDIFASAERIADRYADASTRVDSFRSGMCSSLDSLAAIVRSSGCEGTSVMLVLAHDRDSGSLSVVGRATFLGDVVTRIGLELSAPDTGTYPLLSVESVLALSPRRIVYLLPDARDPEEVLAHESSFWEACGFEAGSVHVLAEDYLLVPGPRLILTAGRIADCVLSPGVDS